MNGLLARSFEAMSHGRWRSGHASAPCGRVRGPRIGPYEATDLIAVGGMSVVYAAHHHATGERVALKVVPLAWAGAPDLRERLRREAAALARVDHPNVVRLVEAGLLGPHAGGGLYLAMERLAWSLDHELRDGCPLPIERALSVARSILAGLGALHAAGLVHRDVKPPNVLLRPDGTAVLADLGLAVEAEASAQPLTPWNAVVGTAEYMAPERIDGQPADPRSDLYAVGVTLHEMLAGRTPFTGRRPSAVLRAQRRDRPPRLPGHVPAPLAAAVEQALRKRPEERFESAREMADALAARF